MNKLALRSFDPFPSLFPTSFFDTFEKMFGELDFYHPENQSWNLRGFPRGDVYVEGDKGIVELALAGFSKEQLSVQVEDNKLIISAKKCEETKKESRTLARRAFTETFCFGEDFDLEKADVSFKDGLLRIEVPKIKQEPKALKSIEIK